MRTVTALTAAAALAAPSAALAVPIDVHQTAAQQQQQSQDLRSPDARDAARTPLYQGPYHPVAARPITAEPPSWPANPQVLRPPHRASTLAEQVASYATAKPTDDGGTSTLVVILIAAGAAAAAAGSGFAAGRVTRHHGLAS